MPDKTNSGEYKKARAVETFDTLTFCSNVLQDMAYVAKSSYNPEASFVPVKSSA